MVERRLVAHIGPTEDFRNETVGLRKEAAKPGETADDFGNAGKLL